MKRGGNVRHQCFLKDACRNNPLFTKNCKNMCPLVKGPDSFSAEKGSRSCEITLLGHFGLFFLLQNVCWDWTYLWVVCHTSFSECLA